MDKLTKYQHLKEEVAGLKSEHDKAQGALSEIKKLLTQKTGCQTFAECRKLEARLEREEREIQTKFDKRLEQFIKKWEEVFDGKES